MRWSTALFALSSLIWLTVACSGSDTNDDTGGSCPQGAANCPCYSNKSCDPGLVCNATAGACAPANSECQGAPGCVCYPNASCDAGLTCSGGACVQSVAAAGGGTGTGGDGTGGSATGGATSSGGTTASGGNASTGGSTGTGGATILDPITDLGCEADPNLGELACPYGRAGDEVVCPGTRDESLPFYDSEYACLWTSNTTYVEDDAPAYLGCCTLGD